MLRISFFTVTIWTAALALIPFVSGQSQDSRLARYNAPSQECVLRASFNQSSLTSKDDEAGARLFASSIDHDHSDPHQAEYCEPDHGCGIQFKFTEFNIYPTFSFLNDQVGNYCEFEFASETELGNWEMENRTVLNVADLPGTIKLGPTNPGGGPPTEDVRGNGFGDVLSGFFFSRKKPHSHSHFGVGPVITFPTASNEIIGSGQWTAGPGAHFSSERGRLTTGFFVWQSWGLTDDPSKKRINQLFGKPFLIYSLNEKWNLVYVPLGMSHSWKSKNGDDWTVPVGGGIRRLFEIHGQKMGLQVQAFDYVARKPKDPEWELRFTIEFLFD